MLIYGAKAKRTQQRTIPAAQDVDVGRTLIVNKMTNAIPKPSQNQPKPHEQSKELKKNPIRPKGDTAGITNIPNTYIPVIIYPSGGFEIQSNKPTTKLRIAQSKNVDSHVLPISDCYVSSKPIPSSKMHPLKWLLSVPMRFDVCHERDFQGTIAHCVNSFERFVNQVILGLKSLQQQKIYCEPERIRIYTDEQRNGYVAPHNLFLLSSLRKQILSWMNTGSITSKMLTTEIDSLLL